MDRIPVHFVSVQNEFSSLQLFPASDRRSLDILGRNSIAQNVVGKVQELEAGKAVQEQEDLGSGRDQVVREVQLGDVAKLAGAQLERANGLNVIITEGHDRRVHALLGLGRVGDEDEEAVVLLLVVVLFLDGRDDGRHCGFFSKIEFDLCTNAISTMRHRFVRTSSGYVRKGLQIQFAMATSIHSSCLGQCFCRTEGESASAELSIRKIRRLCLIERLAEFDRIVCLDESSKLSLLDLSISELLLLLLQPSLTLVPLDLCCCCRFRNPHSLLRSVSVINAIILFPEKRQRFGHEFRLSKYKRKIADANAF